MVTRSYSDQEPSQEYLCLVPPVPYFYFVTLVLRMDGQVEFGTFGEKVRINEKRRFWLNFRDTVFRVSRNNRL